MTKAADPNLEPFIDNLWYFDSVVSTKPPLNQRKPHKPYTSPPSAAINETSAADDDDQHKLASFSESQLPLSTGGESSPRAAGYSSYDFTDKGSDDESVLCGADGKSCPTCERAGSRRPSMCELIEKMEEGEGELPAKEVRLWMEKLGLEYTEDGTMIRRVPNADFGSQQKLDFSEFVCLNRFIEDECSSQQDANQDSAMHMGYSDAHMASLHEVFQLFDKDDTGVISPSDLCAALTKLGLRRSS